MMREDRQSQLDSSKTMPSQRESVIAKVHEEMSVELTMVWSERDSAFVSHHELFVSIRLFVKACEKCKKKAADTLAKLYKLYGEWRMVRSEAHVWGW